MAASIAADKELIKLAEKHIQETRYLEAVRLLRQVKNDSLLLKKHRHALAVVGEMEAALEHDLAGSVPSKSDGWQKQSEAHANYDFVIYYKVDRNNKLTLRIDLVIESSLLVPLLSVLNESDLYCEWMPSFRHPRVGFRRSIKMHELGRGNQIVLVTVDMPFPLKARECIQHAMAIDAIEEKSAILVHIQNIPSGMYDDGIDIPEAEPGIVRIDFNSEFLIRACPDDHPALKSSKKQYPAGEHKLLFTITQQVDAHVAVVPLRLINFFTRQVIKHMVINLVDVAADVRSGKRPNHMKAIDQNQELYGWVSQRVETLFSKLVVEERF